MNTPHELFNEIVNDRIKDILAIIKKAYFDGGCNAVFRLECIDESMIGPIVEILQAHEYKVRYYSDYGYPNDNDEGRSIFCMCHYFKIKWDA